MHRTIEALWQPIVQVVSFSQNVTNHFKLKVQKLPFFYSGRAFTLVNFQSELGMGMG